MKFLLVALVQEDTKLADRIFYLSYCVMMLRLWRQNIHDLELSLDNFTTPSVWHAIEINFVMLINLALSQKAENISEMNSQVCEEHFRTTRCLTGANYTDVNCTLKGYFLRLQKIEASETIKHELKEVISFPNLSQKDFHQKICEILSEEEIQVLIESGEFAAQEKAQQLGIHNTEIELKDFLRRNNRIVQGQPIIVDNNNLEINQEFQDDAIDQRLVFDNLEVVAGQTDDNCFLVREGNRIKKIRKIQLIFMLQNDRIKLNNDITHRFIQTRANTLYQYENSQNSVWKCSIVTKGDYVVMFVNNILYFGQVVNMKFYKERTAHRSAFNYHSVNLNDVRGRSLGFFLCPYYKIVEGAKHIMNDDLYFDSDHYILHAKAGTDFLLEEIMRQIMIQI
jgi:hypothetical protein